MERMLRKDAKEKAMEERYRGEPRGRDVERGAEVEHRQVGKVERQLDEWSRDAATVQGMPAA